MAWSSSNRRRRLPKDWKQRREAQLKADGYRCRVIEYGERCQNPATEVDHVEAMTDNHARLQSMCSMHHGRKSAQEGHEAKAQKRAATSHKFRRASEAHPSAWR